MNTLPINSGKILSRPAAGSASDAMDERYARRLTARLSAGTSEMPHDIAERLRVARTQAVARRRHSTRQATSQGKGTASPGLGRVWWSRLGALVPLVALVAGLLAISIVQDDDRLSEIADVDSALLADDLPPTAYADPGFAQFLKRDAATH